MRLMIRPPIIGLRHKSPLGVRRMIRRPIICLRHQSPLGVRLMIRRPIIGLHRGTPQGVVAACGLTLGGGGSRSISLW